MTNASAHFEPQTTIGDYRVIGYCAGGGMGDVYKVINPLLQEIFAMKVMRDSTREPGWDERARRFLAEARTTANLRHNNIVTLHTVGMEPTQNKLYLVMDYIGVTPEQRDAILRGQWIKKSSSTNELPLKRVSLTLEEVLQIAGPLSENIARFVLIDIASALHYAHTFGEGIYHCDLKPGNILLRGDGHAMIADFGLAQMCSVSAGDTRKSICGTPDYMAPEQFDPSRPITAAVDIYAFGVMCCRVLTGRFPVGVWERPSERGLNPAWDALIERCIAPDPNQRWASMKEILLFMRDFATYKPPHKRRNPLSVISPKILAAVGLSIVATSLIMIALCTKSRSSLKLTQEEICRAFLDHDPVAALPDPRHCGTLIYPENAPKTLPVSKYTLPHVTRLGIPRQVSEIPEAFWATLPRLEYIACDPQNKTYCAIDGILYRRDDMTRPLVIPPRLYGEITLPKSVVRVVYPWKTGIAITANRLTSTESGAYGKPLKLISDNAIDWVPTP